MEALGTVILLVGTLGALTVALRARVRSALEVHEDLTILSAGTVSPREELKAGLSVGRDRVRLGDEAAAVGSLTDEERRAFKRSQNVTIVLGTIIGLVAQLLIAPHAPQGLLFGALLGFGLSYLYLRIRLHSRKNEYLSELVFHLPLVMERIVMAVSAGHDVISSIRVNLELQQLEKEEGGEKLDPVTRLLDVVFRLTEAGVPFDEALKEVASKVNCPPLRHSFMHIGRAYREGGEVMMPLRELSDSTQLFYQETVDERIAKMPVKATLPLLCTFFGLIVCFVTIPVLQVVTVTTKTRQSAGLE